MQETPTNIDTKKPIKQNKIVNLFLFAILKVWRCFILVMNHYKNLVISTYCYRTTKIYQCNHITFGIYNLYKQKTKLPHPVGIVIGMKVKLGKNCTIYQNVTIGTKDTEDFLVGKYPQIGNNVTIYPNAVIIGDITIGDNAIIGANSLVNKSVPANKTVVGNPAKIL